MANTKGLGKGLSALLGDDVIAAKDERASSLLLPISQVESCSTQPRKSFEPEALSDLADSIRIHGIIQPLTVRKLQSGYYQIIAGERRWRAARMAGLTQVPVVVIEADDRKAMELALIENLQRSDLNPIEEAQGVGHGGAGLAHPLRALVLGHAVLLRQHPVALGLLNGVQILSLEVFDHGQLGRLAVIGLDHDDRNLL